MEDVENNKIVSLIQEEHLWADGVELHILHLITREGKRSTPAPASPLPWELLGG
jgi:hypothetical protein